MSHVPSSSEGNGRDAKTGRFAAGNAFGKGNPFAVQMTLLRAALLNTITQEDVEAAARKLVQMAREGDLAAIKELLDRTIGKPASPVEVTGPDGEPLGVNVQQLTTVVLGALTEHPEAKVAVAAKLKELSHGHRAGAGEPA